MSEVMLLGVLRMPPECWDDTDPIDVAQRYGRYCEAADEIDRLRNAETSPYEALIKAAREIDRKAELQEQRMNQLCNLSARLRKAEYGTLEYKRIQGEHQMLMSINVIDFGAVADLRAALRGLPKP